MDPITIAAAAVPFLIKAAEALGDKIWEKTSNAAADEAAGFGRRLLDRLRGRGGKDETAGSSTATGTDLAVVEAVRDVVATPGDQAAHGALTMAVRKLLAADPVLMAEVAEMIEKQAPQQRAGDRSVNIGGSMSGGVNATGDSNTITYGAPAS
jgi:hypothetical protein